MQKLKNKTLAIMIAAFLTISMAASILLIPNANAHTPPWTLQTWAYIAVAPNPVGVGQPVFVNMWVDKPMPEAALNDIRRHNYQLTITKPDGINETHTFDVSDPTGVQFYKFVPDQVGVYSFVFYYPGPFGCICIELFRKKCLFRLWQYFSVCYKRFDDFEIPASISIFDYHST